MITGLAAIGVILMHEKKEQQAAVQARRRTESNQQTQSTDEGKDEARKRVEQIFSAEDETKSRSVDEIFGDDRSTTSDETNGESGLTLEGTDAETAEQAAADALLAGRRSEALERYRKLAEQYPDRPVFGEITQILREKLAKECKDDPSRDVCKLVRSEQKRSKAEELFQ
jgi:TolA-binding protein